MGQNSTHKPQPLHHFPNMITRPRGPRFAFEGLVGNTVSGISASGITHPFIFKVSIESQLKFYVTTTWNNMDKTPHSGVTYICSYAHFFFESQYKENHHTSMVTDSVVKYMIIVL